jgi:hypothetical protein
MHQPYVASGNPAIDAIAAERRQKYAPVLTPQACACCSKAVTAKDFWVCRWVYFFSKFSLASLLATVVGKVFISTAKVPHATYHWLCADCVRAAKSARFKSGLVRFVGLFAALLGLIGVMIVLAALFAVSLSQRDRALVSSWSWVPVVLLVLGVTLTLLARAVRLPGLLGELDRPPFVLEAIFHSEPAKLDELRRDYPDLYAIV